MTNFERDNYYEKPAGKECIICGRSIRHGTKYCYEHRHSRNQDGVNYSGSIRRKPMSHEAVLLILVVVLAAIYVAIYYLFNSMINQPNISGKLIVLLTILISLIITALIIFCIYTNKRNNSESVKWGVGGYIFAFLGILPINLFFISIILSMLSKVWLIILTILVIIAIVFGIIYYKQKQHGKKE